MNGKCKAEGDLTGKKVVHVVIWQLQELNVPKKFPTLYHAITIPT